MGSKCCLDRLCGCPSCRAPHLCSRAVWCCLSSTSQASCGAHTFSPHPRGPSLWKWLPGHCTQLVKREGKTCSVAVPAPGTRSSELVGTSETFLVPEPSHGDRESANTQHGGSLKNSRKALGQHSGVQLCPRLQKTPEYLRFKWNRDPNSVKASKSLLPSL